MYARTVAGRTLTFGVSGMLMRDGLIMYDRETESLWTQIDGRAIQGPMAGQRLEPIPSIHATWSEWEILYPDSMVLKKRGVSRSTYADYNRSRSRLGIMGRRNTDSRLAGKARILGVRVDGLAKAFPIDAVRKARLVEDELNGMPLLLVAASDRLPPLAYRRDVDGRTLRFELTEEAPPMLRDRETGSRWQLSDGAAVDGPLAGRRLARVVAHPAFWFGWQGYFPDSEIWTPGP